MRLRALTVLSKILAKQLDPRYRKTAVDVLRLLDQADAIEGGKANHARSASGRPPTKAQPQVDLNGIITEISQIVERRRSRELEPPLMAVLGARLDDPRQAAEEVVSERQGVVSRDHEPPIVEVEQTEGTPLPAEPPKEASEGKGLEVLEPSTSHNATEAEASMGASSEGHAPDVKLVWEVIPGHFPRRLRLVQRRG
jgi:hypothetical protein